MKSPIRPFVKELYVASSAGGPMLSVDQVEVSERGIVGDRYGEGVGRFSHGKRETIRHISLIALEAIEEANELLDCPFTAAETRRNIVTEGVDLNRLVGIMFQVGPLVLRGVELCTPCKVPSTLSGKPDFTTAFENCGGLRVEVLKPGILAVGDEIVLQQ